MFNDPIHIEPQYILLTGVLAVATWFMVSRRSWPEKIFTFLVTVGIYVAFRWMSGATRFDEIFPFLK